MYSVKKGSVENSDNTSISTNYNFNELNQLEKFHANKTYLNIINRDYNSMSPFNNIDINNNYGHQDVTKNPYLMSEEQHKQFSLKQLKKDNACKKLNQSNEVSNINPTAIVDLTTAPSKFLPKKINFNYNLNSSDHKSYKIYESNKAYMKKSNNTDGVVASIV